MRSLIIKTIVASLALIICFTSCKKDTDGFIGDPNTGIEEVMYTSDIYGIVSTRDDLPIEGATITFKGNTTTTDADGVYAFKNVEVGSQHNVVQITKDGYFESARTFRSAGSSTQYQKSLLVEKNFGLPFNTSEDATVTSNRVTINFPPNSIVVDATGEQYNGEVLVAIHGFDPSLFRLDEFMPGDMTGREEDNSLSTLESFGMVNVELQSPLGVKLQVGNDKEVQMSYRVNDKYLADAPETIDMWSFDFDLGLWVKDGQATLDGDTYVGKVSHFSCWNYDVSAPSVVVNGKIVAEGVVFSYFRVTLLNNENKGGRGWTDSDGTFSGRVEAGVELTLSVYHNHNCWGESGGTVYQQTVGPFNEDTDLGIITIDVGEIDLLVIKGTAVDCDLNPVTDGRVFLTNNWSFPIIDGEYDILFPACGAQVIDIRFVDVMTLNQSFVYEIAVPGDYNLGQVTICGDEAEHITIDNLFSTPFNLVDSLSFYKYSTAFDDVLGDIQGFLYDDIISVNVNLKFYIGNAFSMPSLEVESYDLTKFVIVYSDDIGSSLSYSMNDGQTGTITIDSITLDGDYELVKGTYTADCTEETTQEIKTITGSFNLRYKS